MKHLDVTNMAWSFSNFYPEIANRMRDNFTGEWDPKFLECMQALAIVARYSFGDCYRVKDFMERVHHGMFTSYNGGGYFYDENGNQVGNIWDSYIPEKAKFALWFNQ